MHSTYYQDDMSDVGSFSTVLGGVATTINYKIHKDKVARATFTYLGKSYSFQMSKWKGTNFSNFQLKFHTAYNDPVKYGSSSIDPLGLPTINTTPDQQTEIVVQTVKDCFRYLDQLLLQQQKSIIDYSCWYRERYSRNLSTYEDFIQLVTCHCIVHAEFLAPNVPWTVVPFVV